MPAVLGHSFALHGGFYPFTAEMRNQQAGDDLNRVLTEYPQQQINQPTE